MRLPIDGHLPGIVDALRESGAVVVEAPPGAGKTTRIPRAWLDAAPAAQGEILVVQPRRLAARMAARRVAHELGEPLGERCGLQVRFETVAGPRTRIRFVTDGVVVRRLRDDPTLAGVGAVLLDEFHERRIAMDLVLALCRRLRATTRPDLRLGIMSATLDGERVADFVECPRLRTEGRAFPVEILHRAPRRDEPLTRQVSHALRETIGRGPDGHVLVFLPGAREIRAVAEVCEAMVRHAGLDLVTLHGDLSPAEQDRAVGPGPARVILSTNVAETSVTIEGVTTVIDSGLARLAGHDPWSGVPTLKVDRISQASAIQRAGRAGRTRAGRCIRLYSEPDFARRRPHDTPEILRADLADVCLDLALAGVEDPGDFAWFEPPPAAALDAGSGLLTRLGAIRDGTITALGRRMAALPAHPRLARMILEASGRGAGATGAAVAALLGEAPLRRPDAGSNAGPTVRAGADVLVELDRLDGGARRRVHRVRDQLARALGPGARRDTCSDVDEAIGMALLASHPDRVGRIRNGPGGERSVLLPGIGAVRLAPHSAVVDSQLAVAVAIEERTEGASRRPLVRSAAAIEPEWLLELFPDEVHEDVVATFEPQRERVEARRQTRFGGLVIEEIRLDEPPAEASAVLRDAALRAGPAAFVRDADALEDLRGRIAFARTQGVEVPELDGDRILAVLGALCEGRSSFAQIRQADLLAHLHTGAGIDRAELDRVAPTHVTTAGGRRLRVHYPTDAAPWVSSRLQDFFGTARGPTVARGRVPVVLHLLAPNRRAVQVTTDLAGFWRTHYPGIRKTLMRRYPKHAWPEDPLGATPPAPRGRRR